VAAEQSASTATVATTTAVRNAVAAAASDAGTAAYEHASAAAGACGGYDAVAFHSVYIDGCRAAAAGAAARAAAGSAYDEADGDAASFAADASVADERRTVCMVLRDFSTLLAKSLAEKWSDTTRVPPSVFGPMWPEDPPHWATKGGNEKPKDQPPINPRKMILRVMSRPDATAEEIAADLDELYHALSAYHIAHGGSGLKLEEFEMLVNSCVLEEV
jgi:hypothetical protein